MSPVLPPRPGTPFGDAWAAIDDVNADDPDTLVVRGERRPKELAHADLMVEWILRLSPEADELQLLAARANHLRRWSLPRGAYPDGRSGYLRWRTALKKQHAAEAGEILARAGYGADEVQVVSSVLRKEHLPRGGEVPPDASDAVRRAQLHEDALCLVFLETQFEALVDRLGHDRAVPVTGKTLAKMSPEARRLAGSIDLSPRAAAVVAEAAGPPRDGR